MEWTRMAHSTFKSTSIITYLPYLPNRNTKISSTDALVTEVDDRKRVHSSIFIAINQFCITHTTKSIDTTDKLINMNNPTKSINIINNYFANVGK